MFNTAFLDIPPLGSAHGRVELPGSKSISNRVLLLAALSAGTTRVHGLLDSDDTRVMLAALRELGCGVSTHDGVTEVVGLAGQPRKRAAKLFLGNAGTAIRPLTAALALLGGDFQLSGVARMHERPIGDLVDALRLIGCSVDYLGVAGFPPLHIGQPTLDLSAPIRVRGDVSSQFLTALLMALPLRAQHAVVIEVVGELISKPYIAITLAMLERFGIDVARDGWQGFTIPARSQYRTPGDVFVEADASSASYFIALGAIAAVSPHAVRIEGVGADSVQGDIRFVEAARAMGAQVEAGPNFLSVARGAHGPLKAIDIDCNHIPDAAMTLAVMALYANGPSRLRNIASWRVKETDRLSAMACELRKLGATVEEGSDFLAITPPVQWHPASIATYDDHRMAMCFALAAFNPAGVPVRIEEPGCVSKTYPDFFETFFAVTHTPDQCIPVICVDGPTASGKGSLASAVAERLGYHYLDSGALYRVTAVAAVRAGLALDEANEARIAAVARDLPLRFSGGKVWLAGADVTELIRSEQAGMNASKVSALPLVRDALVDLQRAARKLPGLVTDGRDMGTVIFPDAPLKVYLTASAETRALRRHKQLISKGFSTTLAALREDLEARDLRDSTRLVAPLKASADALLLDNSALSIAESVVLVLQWWQDRQPFGTLPKD